jgi:hypothetical protein
MVQRALWALILIAAVLLAAVSFTVQDNVAVLVSLGVGVLWLALDIRGAKNFGSLFFLCFLIVAILASMKDAAPPLTVLAVASALAAWDLSAFRARTATVEDETARAALERVHLRKLSITAGLGLVAALIPLFVHITISFVALALVLLVAVIALHSTVSSQRRRQRS